MQTMKKFIVAIFLLLGVVTQSCVTTRYPFAKSKECAKTFDKIHKLIHEDKDIAGRTVYYIERGDSLIFMNMFIKSECLVGINFDDVLSILGNPTEINNQGGRIYRIYFDDFYKHKKMGEMEGVAIFMRNNKRRVEKDKYEYNIRYVGWEYVKEDGAKSWIVIE